LNISEQSFETSKVFEFFSRPYGIDRQINFEVSMKIRNIILTDGHQRIILRVKPLRINVGRHIYERIWCMLSKHKLSLVIAYQFSMMYSAIRSFLSSQYSPVFFKNIIHLEKQLNFFQLESI